MDDEFASGVWTSKTYQSNRNSRIHRRMSGMGVCWTSRRLGKSEIGGTARYRTGGRDEGPDAHQCGRAPVDSPTQPDPILDDDVCSRGPPTCTDTASSGEDGIVSAVALKNKLRAPDHTQLPVQTLTCEFEEVVGNKSRQISVSPCPSVKKQCPNEMSEHHQLISITLHVFRDMRSSLKAIHYSVRTSVRHTGSHERKRPIEAHLIDRTSTPRPASPSRRCGPASPPGRS